MIARALNTLKSCECSKDPDRDGCYRCLFAYRTAYDMAHTSRRRAVEIFTDILKHREKVTRADSLDKVRMGGIFDSKLESMFVSHLAHAKVPGSQEPITLTKEIVSGRPGWRVRLGGETWEMSKGTFLGINDGVEIDSEPDFILWPVTLKATHRPVAIFLDGWTYHRERLADDFLKRMAVTKSQNFYVWSMDYFDIYDAMTHKGHGAKLGFLGRDDAFALALQKSFGTFGLMPHTDLLGASRLEVLLRYLSTPWEARTWQRMAAAYAMGVLATPHAHEVEGASLLGHRESEVNQALVALFSGVGHIRSRSLRDEGLEVICGLESRPKEMNDAVENLRVIAVLQAYDSQQDDRAQRVSWEKALGLSNLLQFLPQSYVIATGPLPPKHDLGFLAHTPILVEQERSEALDAIPQEVRAQWEACLEDVLQEYQGVLRKLLDARVPVPRVGDEVQDERGRALCTPELLWLAQRAVVVEDEEEALTLGARGFFALTLDQAREDLNPLIAHLHSFDS